MKVDHILCHVLNPLLLSASPCQELSHQWGNIGSHGPIIPLPLPLLHLYYFHAHLNTAIVFLLLAIRVIISIKILIILLPFPICYVTLSTTLMFWKLVHDRRALPPNQLLMHRRHKQLQFVPYLGISNF